MKLKLLVVDETEYWVKEIREKVDRIDTIYLVDIEWCVHLCEMTPSYKLHFLYHDVVFGDHEFDEEVLDLVMEARTAMVTYIHVTSSIRFVFGITWQVGPDEDPEEAFEEAYEFFQCNHYHENIAPNPKLEVPEGMEVCPDCAGHSPVWGDVMGVCQWCSGSGLVELEEDLQKWIEDFSAMMDGLMAGHLFTGEKWGVKISLWKDHLEVSRPKPFRDYTTWALFRKPFGLKFRIEKYISTVSKGE